MLSHLISGFLVYVAILYSTEISPALLGPLPSTAIAYTLGYLVNTFSAWYEPFLNCTWKGKPSTQLLQGGRSLRIQFYEYQKAQKLLAGESKDKDASTDALFKIAMRYARDDKRVLEMNEQYAFSRSIFMAALVIISILSFQLSYDWRFWLISLLFIIILWYRAKERGFYYAREVLFTYLNKHENR